MIKVNGVIDIETENWTTYVIGGLARRIDDGPLMLFTTTDPDTLFDRMMEAGGQIWAHNGGRFDFLWWLDLAIKRKIPCRISLAGTRITRIDAGRLVLRDSAALIPMSLAKGAKLAGKEKTEVGFPCECARNCGGYCAIRRDMPLSRLRVVRQYLENDLSVTHAMIESVIAFASDNMIELAGTIGGTSWRTAMGELGLPATDWEPNEYTIARQGYYGGRTQVFRPRAERGHRYDINSAYPAALSRTLLPVGDRSCAPPEVAKRAYARGREGIYKARVRVPDMHVPPLPWHTDERVAYPVGQITGAWTGLELRAAEEAGVEIEGFLGCMVWSDAEPILAPYVDRIWALRHAAGKSTSWGQWLKWLANSLTGKLAQQPEVSQAIVLPDPSKIKACPADWDCRGRCGFKCCAHKCVRKCRRWSMLDRAGHIWSQPLYRLSPCAHVQWAAYLTAATRIELRAQLVADDQEGETAIYCDTDSVYATIERERNIGSELGEWQSEGAMRDWRSIAPKAYRYTDDDSGKVVARCKGVQDLTTEQFDRFAAGGLVTNDRGVKSFKTAARKMHEGSIFARKLLERSNHADGLHFGDRILHTDGLTRAQECNNLLAHERIHRSRKGKPSVQGQSNPAQASRG